MITQQQYDELKAERDALAAQNKELLCYVADAEAWFNKHDPNGYVSPKRNQAQQHLAKIRAEAIESLLPKCIFSEDHKVKIITESIIKNHAANARKGAE